MSKRWRGWAWVVAAVAALGGGVAMYVFEQSQQEEIENLLQAALQEFQAEPPIRDNPTGTAREND